ncbi:hypothetical protein JOB18_004278 [Solea senegalensis]|uniref:Uncharacterized protein n=1 Tax=Solea senegalensis TaxID=28829 RepID=A0AAV6R8Z8_SOLSE|nr:hypothetical protein JOB18_004278 [Solea senegalensis]
MSLQPRDQGERNKIYETQTSGTVCVENRGFSTFKTWQIYVLRNRERLSGVRGRITLSCSTKCHYLITGGRLGSSGHCR